MLKSWMLAIACATLSVIVRITAWITFRHSVLFAPAELGDHDRSVYLQAIRHMADGTFRPTGSFEYFAFVSVAGWNPDLMVWSSP